MSRTLPLLPSLRQQRHAAKDLLKAWKRGDAEAYARFGEHHPRYRQPTLAGTVDLVPQLADAQLVIAREYGLRGWRDLKRQIEARVGTNANEQAVRLTRAVAAGELAEAQRLLARQPSLSRIDLAENNEHRALHYAVRNRDGAMVRLLLEAGADPGQGVHPLREATSPRTLAHDRGYHELIAIFDEVATRGSLQMRVPAMAAPLHEIITMIADGDESEAVQRLAADAQLLSACDANGDTLLHHAARWGRLAVMDHLLTRESLVAVRNVDGLSAVDLAVRYPGTSERTADCARAAERLRRQAGCEISLETAVCLGDAALVRRCAAQAPQRLHPAADQPCGLVQLAIRHQQLPVLRLLLELGCDPDDRHRLPNMEQEVLTQGEPLWLAAQQGNLEAARILLTHGADVNAVLYASGNALSRAYEARDDAMIALLSSHGGILSAETAVLEGDPTRALAALAGMQHITPELLGHAICGGSPEIVRWCLQRSPQWAEHSYALLCECMVLWRCGGFRRHRDFDTTAYLTIMQLLLDQGADATARGRWGVTALHRSVTSGVIWGQDVATPQLRTAFATLLLEQGARLDTRDEELLSTPLGWAARWGRLELATLFLERGAPANEPEAEPWATPLSWALHQGHDQLAAVLRRYGALR